MKRLLSIFFLATIILTSCTNDERNDPINLIGEVKVYELGPTEGQSVFGTATFIRHDDKSTTVKIELESAMLNKTHPANIYFNSLLEGGKVAVQLNPVNPQTGYSTTTFSTLENGTEITYKELMKFDGHIKVLLSAANPEVLTKADIGGNELTGQIKNYVLDSADIFGVEGTASFAQRKNGEILATVSIDSALNASNQYPVHVHFNTIVEGGPVALTLNPIEGSTGKSKTNVTTLDDGTNFTFKNLLNFDGYLNVHKSQSQTSVIFAHVDIGQNQLTGDRQTYTLNPVSDTLFSGQATFEKRLNNETLITVSTEGATAGTLYPTHIHMDSVQVAPTTISVTLNDVKGTNGISKTNVTAFDNGDSLTYAMLIDYSGYLDVHSPVDSVLVRGNIGASDQ